MPLTLPTTQELADVNRTKFESRLGQTIPQADRAFLNELSVVEAETDTVHLKYAAERSQQNLALTATGEDLEEIGENYGVIRKPAEAAQLTATLPATTGTSIPITTDFVGDSNNVRYRPDESVTAVAGVATLTLTATETGVSGNLQVGDTLTIGAEIAGAGTTATVTAILNLGVEEEDEEDYRRRVLAEIRTVGGGGNSTDYRTWAERVGGVEKAFPYAGKPYLYDVTGAIDFVSPDLIQSGTVDFEDAGVQPGDEISISNTALNDGVYIVQNVVAAGTIEVVEQTIASEAGKTAVNLKNNSLPGDRTVYVQALSSIDPDGIAPQSLLDEVRAAINFSITTGLAQPPLGEIDSTLYVESISRRPFYIEIRDLTVDASQESALKTDIEAAVEAYFAAVFPFILGLDFVGDRNDTITDLTVSTTIQNIFNAYGASASGIGLGITPGTFIGTYQLVPGELAKLGSITYA
jgi:hypothetical protein